MKNINNKDVNGFKNTFTYGSKKYVYDLGVDFNNGSHDFSNNDKPQLVEWYKKTNSNYNYMTKAKIPTEDEWKTYLSKNTDFIDQPMKELVEKIDELER